MPIWLQIALGVGALVAPWIAGYFGVMKGMSVGLAVHSEQIKSMQAEIVLLRQRFHDHASHITRHEADLSILMRKAGVG